MVKEKQLTIKLGKRTEEAVTSLEREPEFDFAGLKAQELTPALAEQFGYSEDETGVIITQVREGSEAERKGIRPWLPHSRDGICNDKGF